MITLSCPDNSHHHAKTYLVWRVASGYDAKEKRLHSCMYYFAKRENAEEWAKEGFFMDAILLTHWAANHHGSLKPKFLQDDGYPEYATAAEIEIGSIIECRETGIYNPEHIVYSYESLQSKKTA